VTAPAISVVAPAAVNPYSSAEGYPDVNVRKLTIQRTLNQQVGIEIDVTNVITSGTATDSFIAAPQIVFSCLDRGYKALNSGAFEDTVDISLDGTFYRLVEVSLTAVETLELTWEHKIAALLRTHKSFLSVQRGAMTRAQFVELLLREILPDFGDIILVCPEVNTVQAVATAKKTGRSLTSKSLAAKKTTTNTKGSDFGLSSLKIRYWDGSTVVLSQSQLDNASIALETAYQLGASPKATLALIEACIVEPSNPFENTAASESDGTSAGILQMGGGGTKAPWATDVALSCQHALQDPGSTGKGGMMSLAAKNPTWSAGQIAQAEQGSAFGGRYDQAQQGAQAVIAAYASAGGFAATGASAAYGNVATTAQYEFTRGQTGQTEDSYTCALRLAAEVQWRFFIVGQRTVYFCSDDDLLTGPPLYAIDTVTPGVAGVPTFDIEMGGRTIVSQGHRVPKPSEMTIPIRTRLLEAGVGGVINIAGYGPASQSWLIKQIERDLFDTAGTIDVQSPQKALPEPVASVSTNDQPTAGGSLPLTGLTGSPIDKAYAASQAMSARDLPYVLGGGHTGSWVTAAKAPGYDCSSSVSMVLYAGGMMGGFAGPIVSGDFLTWGDPGPGTQMTVWACNGHVFIEWYGRPAKRFDTVPGPGPGEPGPHLRYSLYPSPNDEDSAAAPFLARHWRGF
jgi:hypothetical protein